MGSWRRQNRSWCWALRKGDLAVRRQLVLRSLHTCGRSKATWLWEAKKHEHCSADRRIRAVASENWRRMFTRQHLTFHIWTHWREMFWANPRNCKKASCTLGENPWLSYSAPEGCRIRPLLAFQWPGFITRASLAPVFRARSPWTWGKTMQFWKDAFPLAVCRVLGPHYRNAWGANYPWANPTELPWASSMASPRFRGVCEGPLPRRVGSMVSLILHQHFTCTIQLTLFTWSIRARTEVSNWAMDSTINSNCQPNFDSRLAMALGLEVWELGKGTGGTAGELGIGDITGIDTIRTSILLGDLADSWPAAVLLSFLTEAFLFISLSNLERWELKTSIV